jgi:alpha-tubulin suppressor-like RCC1 family protein
MTKPALMKDDKGELLLDENGHPKPKYLTENGQPDGKPLLDLNGEPRTERVLDPEQVIKHFLTPGPVDWSIPGKREILSFCFGANHFLVVARDRGTFDTRVWSAGLGADGQLGHGNDSTFHKLTPVKALDGKNICKVAAGSTHSLALDMMGENIYAWGAIGSGKLGLFDEKELKEKEKQGFKQDTPKAVPFPDTLRSARIIDICCGEETNFAVTNEGDVLSWGFNSYTQGGHTCNNEFIFRPRKVDIAATALTGNKAKKCAVLRAASAGQHSLFLVKRFK